MSLADRYWSRPPTCLFLHEAPSLPPRSGLLPCRPGQSRPSCPRPLAPENDHPVRLVSEGPHARHMGAKHIGLRPAFSSQFEPGLRSSNQDRNTRRRWNHENAVGPGFRRSMAVNNLGGSNRDGGCPGGIGGRPFGHQRSLRRLHDRTPASGTLEPRPEGPEKALEKRNSGARQTQRAQHAEFSTPLKQATAPYHNPNVETLQIIGELIEIARDLRAERENGPSVNERAFYDALAQQSRRGSECTCRWDRAKTEAPGHHD